MSRETHVRFCERAVVEFHRATRLLIYGERHLRRILTLYSLYYNETRTHLELGRTHRYDGPSKDLGPSSLYQSCPDCIIATRGYDFREGQV
jgi:hypothetical protein